MTTQALTVARRVPAVAINAWLLRLGVLAVVALIYAPTLDDPFAGDDYLVLAPVQALGPWELIWRAFILQDNIPYWRPLVSPLYALEVHGFGLWPAPYHLVVLGLHLTNVLLVALLAETLTGRRDVGLVAAVFFGVNPAHTTTVAQISSTVELQSVVFYLLTLLCVARFLRLGASHYLSPGVAEEAPDAGFDQASAPSPGSGRSGQRGEGGARRWYAAALACFVLALLTKESTASAAAVVAALFVLLDPVPGRRLRRALLRAAPFVALVPPYALFTYLVETDDPSGVAREMYYVGLHIGQNLWWLAARLAAPFGNGHGPHVSVAGHLGAAVLAAAAITILARGTMLARLLVIWTVVALAPLALWRPEFMLGRFTYQAAIPFSMLLAVLLCRLSRGLQGLPALRLLRAPALAAAIALAGGLTAAYNDERTREALAYAALSDRLAAHKPASSPGTPIVVIGGPFAGPYHALYLQALADARYGAGVTTLRWLPTEDLAPAGVITIRFEQS